MKNSGRPPLPRQGRTGRLMALLANWTSEASISENENQKDAMSWTQVHLAGNQKKHRKKALAWWKNQHAAVCCGLCNEE